MTFFSSGNISSLQSFWFQVIFCFNSSNTIDLGFLVRFFSHTYCSFPYLCRIETDQYLRKDLRLILVKKKRENHYIIEANSMILLESHVLLLFMGCYAGGNVFLSGFKTILMILLLRNYLYLLDIEPVNLFSVKIYWLLFDAAISFNKYI